MKRTIVVLALAFILVLSAINVVTAQENVQPPYLGITFTEHEGGVLVTRVIPNSPAAEAGIKIGDVITAVDGDGITYESFADVIGDHVIGDTLPLTILRDEEGIELDVVLGEQPETDVFQSPLLMNAFAFIQEGDKQIWQVRSLTESHPLYQAGLRSGDTIMEFDGESYSPGKLREFLSDLEDSATVTVTVERNGKKMEMDVPASSLETLDRFSLAFSFSDDAGEPIPFNDFFSFEPFRFFGPRDSLFDRLEEMLDRFFGEEGFQFELPEGVRPEQPNV